MRNTTSAIRSDRKRSDPYCPDLGDVVWLDLSPARGHEQDGRRPVLVLTPRNYNRKTNRCMIAAMTTRVKGYPFEVFMPDGTVVLSDQLRSAAWTSRGCIFKERAPAEVIAEVRAKAGALLGIA